MSTSLVPLQAAGNRPPLYFAHAHGGSVVGYIDLAMRLGDDQPFFGLEATTLDDATIEEMAERYVAAILARQPSGPYLLGGWCMGGGIALEMARQLSDAGHRVPLVIMVQATHARYPMSRPGLRWAAPLGSALARVGQEVGAAREVGRDERRNYVRSRFQRAAKVAQSARVARTAAALSTRSALEAAHTAAYERHEPRPYRGRVAVVRANRQPLGVVEDHSLGWSGLLHGEVILEDIPGSQLRMLDEPRVAQVAITIAGLLADVNPATD